MKVGYTEIQSPTPTQLAALDHCLKTGELRRVEFERDRGITTAAHYRRDHRFVGQPELARMLESTENDVVEIAPDYSDEEIEDDVPVMVSTLEQDIRFSILIILSGLIGGAVVGAIVALW